MTQMTILRMNFICFIISFLSINSQNSRNDNETLVLDFYLDQSKLYSIEESDCNFKIVVYEIIHCNEGPCPFPIIEEKIIENEEECQILKTLFDSIFTKSDIKKQYIFYDEFPEDQTDMIIRILENNNLISILKYEILNNSEKFNKKYKKMGYTYEIEDESESVICTIALGQKPNDGYSIEIKKIKIKGNNVSIYVSEKVPGEDEAVIDALTYPIVQVKFNHFPSSIKVFNYETGDIFPRQIYSI